ncbi:MAG: succinylglutamate desuccinylase/aspartoacylase family protein [Marinobacter sp.]|uniref:succinylglutamate desuccinylase/aspartoacylase family protein n=1 Tax=Marinobacter sp. TaxID=50741 RepID=UPI00299D5543|nr:succinylglutamate desuccinylase/aspartoacylase family protein [Marinobacter sp.]MDX1634467.1 succinylglutamate desuccinylase/aspartoacylase family protein [Marinobacter sp.]
MPSPDRFAPYLIPALLAFTLALLPAPALAQPSGSQLEEPGEDESVDDIEASVPRGQATLPPQPAPRPLPDWRTDVPGAPLGPPVIAPNLDLREVAPVPEPITTEPARPAANPAEEPAAVTEPATGTDPAEQPPTAETPAAKTPAAADLPESDTLVPPAETGDTEAPATADAAPEATAPTAPERAPRATPLQLLGAEVLPGTSTRLAWSPNIAIAGLSMPTPVLVVNGSQPGPSLCLTAAIHGDELNGIEIVRRVMYDLEPDKLSGRVIGVPIVNVQGFQQGSRYLPDRRDLNRHFPGSPRGSLADRIAYSLFTDIIGHCDMLVDIHTGSLKRTNLPQLRADMNQPAVAEFTLGFDAMAVVHSSGSEGMLRNAAVEAGIVAVTMEAGESLRIQENQIKAGVHSLTALMERQGMISRLFVWGEPEPVYYNSEWVRAGHGGILFSQVELGDRISRGQILGVVADPITNAQHPIRATSDGRVIGMAVDQVVMAGFAAYHVGSEAETPGE